MPATPINSGSVGALTGSPPVTPNNTLGVAVAAGAGAAAAAMFSASGAESLALPSAPVTRTMNGPIPAETDGSLNDHLPSGPAMAVPMTLPSAPMICTVAPGAAVPVKSIG